MAKPNPFASKGKAPPFGAKGKAPPFAKKGAPVAAEKPAFFKKGGKVK